MKRKTTKIKAKSTMPTIHMLHMLDTNVGEVGVTVRLGLKWNNLVNIGDWVALCVCMRHSPDHSSVLNETHYLTGIGKVVELWTGAFTNIPARLIEQEHEMSSRNYSGLFDSMKRAYGTAFNADSVVTIVAYERVK